MGNSSSMPGSINYGGLRQNVEKMESGEFYCFDLADDFKEELRQGFKKHHAWFLRNFLSPKLWQLRKDLITKYGKEVGISHFTNCYMRITNEMIENDEFFPYLRMKIGYGPEWGERRIGGGASRRKRKVHRKTKKI